MEQWLLPFALCSLVAFASCDNSLASNERNVDPIDTEETVVPGGEPIECGDTVCGQNNASATCNSGTCILRCAEGFADCDGRPENGCEDLAGEESCSACGSQCTQDEYCVADTNGNPTCLTVCLNGELDLGRETDVDCGGACASAYDGGRCEEGKKCAVDEDCQADLVCAASKTCQPPGECNPGDRQENYPCGERCGTKTRVCNDDGRWEDETSCTETGQCKPGQVDQTTASQCVQNGLYGKQVVRCNNQCQWVNDVCDLSQCPSDLSVPLTKTVCTGVTMTRGSTYNPCGSGYYVTGYFADPTCPGNRPNKASCEVTCNLGADRSFRACGIECPSGDFLPSGNTGIDMAMCDGLESLTCSLP